MLFWSNFFFVPFFPAHLQAQSHLPLNQADGLRIGHPSPWLDTRILNFISVQFLKSFTSLIGASSFSVLK